MSDHELLAETRRVVDIDRRTTAELLALLGELDARLARTPRPSRRRTRFRSQSTTRDDESTLAGVPALGQTVVTYACGTRPSLRPRPL